MNDGASGLECGRISAGSSQNVLCKNAGLGHQWHTRSGYSRRSIVENTAYRYKALIGSVMRSRTLQGQRVEARVGCKILNTMAGLGMPESRQVN
jgi:hypothetical protein